MQDFADDQGLQFGGGVFDKGRGVASLSQCGSQHVLSLQWADTDGMDLFDKIRVRFFQFDRFFNSYIIERVDREFEVLGFDVCELLVDTGSDGVVDHSLDWDKDSKFVHWYFVL